MTEPSTKEHVPTPEKLEREARRLARIRHLTVVRDAPAEPGQTVPFRFRDPDPDPKPAA